MITQKTGEQGIAVALVIAIVAVVGVAGLAGAQMYTNSKTSMEADESEMKKEAATEVKAETKQAKEDAESALLELKADFTSNVGSGVNTTLAGIAEVRADLKEAYINADATAKAEWSELENKFAELETEVKTNSENAGNTMDELIASIKSDFSVGVDVETESSSDVEANDSTLNSETNTNTSADSTGDTTTVDSDTTSETEGMFDF